MSQQSYPQADNGNLTARLFISIGVNVLIGLIVGIFWSVNVPTHPSPNVLTIGEAFSMPFSCLLVMMDYLLIMTPPRVWLFDRRPKAIVDAIKSPDELLVLFLAAFFAFVIWV